MDDLGSTKTSRQRGARERRRQTTVRQPPAGALLPNRERRRQTTVRQPPAGARRSRQEKKDLFEGFNPLND